MSFIYIHVFGYPSVVCLSYYLVILYLQLSCYYSVHIVYKHEYFPLHTHSPGRFLTRICTFRYWTLCFYYLADETIYIARNWSFSLSYSGILISLFFLLFPDSRYIRFSYYSSSLFIWYHAWMFIYDIAVIMIHYSFDYSLFRVT